MIGKEQSIGRKLLIPVAIALSTALLLIPSAAQAQVNPDPGVEGLYHGRRADAGGDISTTLVKPSLFTGASVMSIPIAVPPGTGGVQPSLSVSYSSSRSRGNAGTGWAISLPRISRSTRYGTDKAATWLRDEAVFVYGGDELIRTETTETDPFGCSATRYYREVERFQKFLLCEGSDYWVVMERSGTIQTFGKLRSHNSKLVRPTTRLTMEYYLDEVRDTHDLVWQAHYSAYGSPNATSAPRLVRVEYTFLAGANLDPVGATRVVDLTWEARPDGEPEGVEGVEGVTLNYGFMLTTDRRLASAEVSLDDGKTIERVRKYVFTYTNSGDSNRSQLNHVQMFGTTDIESLPQQTFGYQWTNAPEEVSDFYPGFGTYVEVKDPCGFGFQHQDKFGNITIDAFDINGDGYLDLVNANAHTDDADTGPDDWTVCLGDGEGGFAVGMDWKGASTNVIRETTKDSAGNQDVTTDLVDMNGDGLPDRFDGTTVDLNTGGAFSAQAWSNPVSGPIRDFTHQSNFKGTVSDLIDMTGDGCPDQVVVMPVFPFGWFGAWKWSVYRNLACDPTPTLGFSAKATTLWFRSPKYLSKDRFISFDFDPKPPASRGWKKDGLLDFNGDGLRDFYDGSTGTIKLGSALGFVPESVTTYGADFEYIWTNEANTPLAQTGHPPLSISIGASGLFWGILDINQDGLPDIVESDLADRRGGQDKDWTSPHEGEWFVWFNTGRGFMRKHQRWITNDRTDSGGITRGHSNRETRTLDFDGDGILDWVTMVGGDFRVYRGYGKKPDLLSNVQNGLGASTRLTYSAVVGGVSGQAGAESMPEGTLHFARHVLSNVTAFPGMGGASTETDFKYWTPFFDRDRRMFRGFATVETNRSDSLGTADRYARHTFAVGDADRDIYLPGPAGSIKYDDHFALAGRRFATKSGPDASTILRESWSAYATDAQSSGADAVRLAHRRGLTRRWLIHPGSEPPVRWTDSEFFYDDAYGNVTRVWNNGEIDVSGTSVGDDEQYITISYALNATDWIVSLPSEVEISSGSSGTPVLRHSRMYYDGQPLDFVTLGDLTLSEVLVSYPGDTDQWAQTDFVHDIYGNVTSVTSPEGSVTDLVWDDGSGNTNFAFLHESSIEVAAGKGVGPKVTLTAASTWDEGFGAPLEITNPNGGRIVAKYDELGRVTQVEASPPDNPAGALVLLSETTITLNGGASGDNSIQQFDYFDTGATEKYESRVYLDGLLRPIQSKSQAAGSQWVTSSVRYTHQGVDHSTVPYFTSVPTYAAFDFNAADPQQADTHRSTLDWAGRTTYSRLHGTDGADRYRSFASFDLGNTLIKDARDVETLYEAGTLGLLAVKQFDDVDVLQATITNVYDRVGNLTRVTDSDSNVWQMAYDSRGLRRSLIDPDLSNCGTPAKCPWLYEFDLEGRMTKQTDALGEEIALSYDELDRLYLKDYLCTSCEDIDVAIEFDDATNGLGLMSKLSRGANLETTPTYDAWQRELSVTQKIETSTRATSMTYDLLDRVKTLTYPSAEVATYTYGASGVTDVVLDTTDIVTDRTYDAYGRATQTDWGNTLSTHQSRDLDQKTDRLRVAGVSDLIDLNYLYDEVGNTTEVLEGVDDWKQTFTYDWNSRLLEAKHFINLKTLHKTWTYTYGSLGNMTYNSEWVDTGSDGNYDYGTNAGPHAVTKIGGVGSTYTLSYDGGGNMINMVNEAGNVTYGYDGDGRMKSVSDTSQTVNPNLAIEYDGLGTRTLKEWTARDSTSREIRYFGAHFEEVFEGVEKYDERFVIVDGQRVAFLTEKQPDKVFYLHPNVLGTVGFVTDESGSVSDTKVFGPYGDLYSASNGGSGIRDGYTGAEHDAEVALVHLGVRQLHPLLGRFPQPDAIVPNPSDPQSFNRYAYVGNNPVRYLDPSGFRKGDADDPFDLPSGEIIVTADRERYICTCVLEDQTFDDWIDEWFTSAEEGRSDPIRTALNTVGRGVQHFQNLAGLNVMQELLPGRGRAIGDGLVEQSFVDAREGRIGTGLANLALGSAYVARADFKKAAEMIGLLVTLGESTVVLSLFRRAPISLFGSAGPRNVGTALVSTELNIGKHAADNRMAIRSVTRRMVEATVRRGKKYWDPKHGVVTSVIEMQLGTKRRTIMVSQNPITGKVTTVIRSSKRNPIPSRLKPIQ